MARSSEETKPEYAEEIALDAETEDDLLESTRDGSAANDVRDSLLELYPSAEQVLGVFVDFVDQYPNPESIVAASEGAIVEEREPLGLRKRTTYFERASEQIVERHGGVVPGTRSDKLDVRADTRPAGD